MRRILFVLLPVSLSLCALEGYSQCKVFTIGPKGDTLNCVDKQDKKQGPWVYHHDELRGEPGYEEEGEYRNDRKEGVWRLYNLTGDLIGLEPYRWGNKNGVCQYYQGSGALVREESWRALNPDKKYDTLQIEDIDHLNQYKTVIVKNDGVAIKDGIWKFYDPLTGIIKRTETYSVGKLETPSATPAASTADASKTGVKPKEVLEFEKKTGKKKVKVKDGSVY
jgi:hypothetical protein